MAAPKSRAPLYLGTAAAAGVGYYLYKAGGSPKAAEKELERKVSSIQHERAVNNSYMIDDLSRASSKMKQELPGRTNQAEKASEKWATEAGAKVDALVRVPTRISEFSFLFPFIDHLDTSL